MTKHAIYVRCSTVKQNTDNQLYLLEEYAKKHNIEYDIFQEVESTSKTRPVKQELMMRLRRGEYMGVICYKLDRIARNFHELVYTIQEIKKLNLVFISVSDNINLCEDNPLAELQYQILASVAMFEKSLTKIRTVDSLKRLKASGRSLGRRKNSKDKKPRKKSGYLLREALKRKTVDERLGLYKSLDNYIKQ